MIRERAESREAALGIELFEASFDRHVFERHMHETYAIAVTLRGVQRFSCAGTTHDSRPGDVIAIEPASAHDGRSGAAGGFDYRMLYIPVATVGEMLSDALPRGREIHVDRPLLHDPLLARWLNAAWRSLAAGNALASEQWLQTSLVRLATVHGTAKTSIDTAIDSCALNRVRAVLHQRMDRTLTVHELAQLAGMSRFQLTRHFQKAFGLPLHAYHLHARLEEGRRRLRDGAEIARVAADLGFADQSHFHRRFKGWFGLTPAEYRRLSK